MKAPARPARRVLRSLTTPPPPRRSVARPAHQLVEPEAGAAALARLTAKLEAIAPSFSNMGDEAWGAWVEELPRDELLEMIGLGNEGIGLIMRAVLYPVERPSSGHTTTGRMRNGSRP